MEGYGERLPRYENRVRLDPERTDRWGLPLRRVDMEFQENELAMCRDVERSAVEMLEAAGLDWVQGFRRDPVPGR